MPITQMEFSASRLDLYPLALLPRAKRVFLRYWDVREDYCGNSGSAFSLPPGELRYFLANHTWFPTPAPAA